MAPAQGYQRPGRTERVSVGISGGQALESFAVEPVISANGRYVVFGSDAPGLVPGDSNGTWDIFVRDRWVSNTELISLAHDGGPANGPSSQSANTYRPDMSADGRYVAFTSDASNLVANDTNGKTDIFVRDRQTGKTEVVSQSSGGVLSNGSSTTVSISADGRYVVFASAGSNLVAADTNGVYDIFIRDRQNRTTALVSRPAAGGLGNGISFPGVLSADGRVVAFSSAASNLVAGDDNAVADVFVRDLQTGKLERVSVSTDGQQSNGSSALGGVSSDGRIIAFHSEANNLIPSDTNGLAGVFAGTDVFVHDRLTERTERVSVRPDGTEAATGVSLDPSVSDDGRYVTFHSDADDLVDADTNEVVDAFVHDRLMGQTERVSLNSVGAQANGHSITVTTSSDGRYIAYASDAGNLVGGDTNGRRDVFVRDRGAAVGPGGLTATPFSSFLGPKVTGAGWAVFTGSQLVSRDDPIDGTGGAGDAGAELVGAGVVYRAEQEDVLVRLEAQQLAPLGPVCGKGAPCPPVLGRPGILYGLSFDLGAGARYEVRAMRAASTSTPPSTPYFGLFRCEQQTACVEIAKLAGSIGSGGEDVRAVIPLSLIGIQPGANLRGIRAFTAVGEASSGAASQMDEVVLGDAEIPIRTLMLGVAAPNVPLHQVPFTAAATLDKGAFSGTLSAPSGSYRLWANACLGFVCSATSALVEAP